MPIANSTMLGKVILRRKPVPKNFFSKIFFTKKSKQYHQKFVWVFQVCKRTWHDPTYGNGGGDYLYFWEDYEGPFDCSEYPLDFMWKWADEYGFDLLNKKVHLVVENGY